LPGIPEPEHGASFGLLIEIELVPISETSLATHMAQRLTALPPESTMPVPLILNRVLGK
jgi:hypothetical protein